MHKAWSAGSLPADNDSTVGTMGAPELPLCFRLQGHIETRNSRTETVSTEHRRFQNVFHYVVCRNTDGAEHYARE